MGKILILGLFRFPNGDAPANRIHALAKSLVAAGLEVFVIANGLTRATEREMEHELGRGCKIDSITIRASNDSYFNRVFRRIFRTFYFARHIQAAGISEIDAVLTNRDTLSLGLLLYCRYYLHRPLVIDSTEWFEAKQFKFGPLSPSYLSFLWKFFVLTPLAGNVIAISKYLTRHFSGDCNATIRVPAQVDSDEYDRGSGPPADGTLKLFYAGTAARKDFIHVAVAGLALLKPQELERIRFTILGPARGEVFSALDGRPDAIDRVSAVTDIPGRVSRDAVLRGLAVAHFSVLLRPVSRYSTAGFPSKVPESLAAGTGIIGNMTSDLAEYLRDGENALIVPECTPEAFALTVRRALRLSRSQLQSISEAARRCAVENFDYRVHSDGVGAFFRALGA